MRRKGKKSMSIVTWMIATNLASVVAMGVLLTIMCGVFIYTITDSDYKTIAQTGSMHIANMLDQLDEGDYHYESETGKFYKGNVLITDEAFQEIQKGNHDMRHTIFWGDTRILSDVTDTLGASVVGTRLTEANIMKAVETEGIYSEKNVLIYGTHYSVCYYPLYNGKEIVGMVFTGVNQEAANIQIISDILISIVIVIVFAAIISVLMITLINRKAKLFGINLTEASEIAEDKKNSVMDLGVHTKGNMEQINDAIEEVTKAVTEQASHTEEIMGSMEEFASSIDIIMNHVQTTSEVADSSIQLIEELKTRLNTLEQVSESNSEEIVSISKQIEEDSDAVADISKIIGAINDIAFQITILSFNASVEAARAGEAGKGFSVVAESIKDLSDKTKDSLEGITEIVQQINDKMMVTTDSSAKLMKENEKVIEALSQTKSQLNDVTDSFEKITENLADIMEESNVITASKNQVIETVSSLAAASEENAAMSEQMKATSDEVISATNRLMEEIERLHEITSIIENVKVLFADNLQNSQN